VETPLEHASQLSERSGNSIWLKREDLQTVFSFKLRGAFNKVSSLSPAQLQTGVICSSAGNHAQGVALAAQKLGTSAVICMPVNTPEIKVRIVAFCAPCTRQAVEGVDGQILTALRAQSAGGGSEGAGRNGATCG
jgi:threonine dehydratase